MVNASESLSDGVPLSATTTVTGRSLVGSGGPAEDTCRTVDRRSHGSTREREGEGLTRIGVGRGRRERYRASLRARLVADRTEYRSGWPQCTVIVIASESFSGGVPLSVTTTVTVKVPRLSGSS